jgi:hypothetical protein
MRRRWASISTGCSAGGLAGAADVSSTASSFERGARQVRRALSGRPSLQRIASRLGVPVWRWYLQRRARAAQSITLPQVVHVDLHRSHLVLPRQAIASLGGNGPQPFPVGLVRGGGWDRQAVPRSSRNAADWGDMPEPGAPPHSSRFDPERPWQGPVVAFDRLGRTCLVTGAGQDVAGRGEGGVTVPALVAVRHKAWARIVLEVRAYARHRGGSAYQPYLHPDLADLPSDQGHERFDLLLAALPIRSGILVDLGANSGYFSHRFEEAGFTCVAVERSEKEAHFLAALRDACGRRFEILKGSLTEVGLPPRPDVVLALNIFHHFLKTERGFGELQEFLQRLEARYLLFGAHLPDDRQMAGAHRNMPPGEFSEWVRERGGFATSRAIGSGADRRPLYLLSRDR